MTYWICPICYAVEHVSVSVEASGALCRLHQLEAKWNARTRQDPWAPLLAAGAARDAADRAATARARAQNPPPNSPVSVGRGEQRIVCGNIVIVLGTPQAG
jgi:hypothetical protein